MNIFVLSLSPFLCAIYHNDKHVVKMILETAQMMCSAHHHCSDYPHYNLYKKTDAFKNHPCTKWIRESVGNYMWAYLLFRELCNEYTYRYGKIHKCDTRFREIFNEIPEKIPKGNMTPFAQAMFDDVKHNNPILAYRNYYMKYKYDFCVWTKREVPYWFKYQIKN